ncbi:MAG: SDR family NAD(P)-dependent oxidoreductase [Deltaproteobacteria bacterium]|uniref:SDR family NAD(P)-dependent oxidoreductase n=1 Tax=Candidatus Zymogenus saltonus TaxID=2844893 RepID=A0A9D8KEU9_9DELT|nr:SDR family NAD(P)-dependent oxidoreductase [Candidatus Zymogenus saltonus]
MEIKGRTAIVTGGASGLGEATVRMFASEGGKVGILDLDERGGEGLASELGGNVVFFKTDVTSEEEVNKAIGGTIDRFGALHFLVNCAGYGIGMRTITKEGPHDLAAFEKLVRLNLIGTFNVASKAAFEMSKNDPDEGETGAGERGVIINVSSAAAFEGQIGQTAYAASKAGVYGLTLPMARDLSGVGIRVVAIAPGLFLTPFFTKYMDEEKIRKLGESVPFPKRMGAMPEFGRLVRDVIKNPYLNGETIRLDGAFRLPPK